MRRVAAALLCASGAVELLGSAAAIAWWRGIAGAFDLPPVRELTGLGFLLGLFIALLAALHFIAARWVARGRPEGRTLGLAIALFLIAAGPLFGVRTGRFALVLVTTTRGLALLVPLALWRPEAAA